MRCDYETGSHTYGRNVRERIYHVARDIGDDETACLDFLQRKLSQNRNRPRAMQQAPSFNELVLLPANLTRLVIDPYREPCETQTVIGDQVSKPLELSGPVLIGGLSFPQLSESGLAILCEGARSAGICLRAPVGTKLPITAQEGKPAEELRVMRVVPLEGGQRPISNASAVELMPGDAGAALDRTVLCEAMEAYRACAPQLPVGVSVGPEEVTSNVQTAVEVGLDFVTLHALKPSAEEGFAAQTELDGLPRIAALVEAVEALREINREEDIDLVYFGCIRDGGDAAKALALGAKAVMIGLAALIAAGISDGEVDADQGVEGVFRFVRSMLMETSILARSCGKTNVHNLEPEDLRSLSIETSRSTGVPLVGRDIVFRETGIPKRG
jgi:glutamate synthase domain-containing protein 2